MLGAPADAQGPGTNGLTEIASLDSTGGFGTKQSEHPAVSPDGRFVALESRSILLPEDPDFNASIYVLDRETGLLALASTSLGSLSASDGLYEAPVALAPAGGRLLERHGLRAVRVEQDVVGP